MYMSSSHTDVGGPGGGGTIYKCICIRIRIRVRYHSDPILYYHPSLAHALLLIVLFLVLFRYRLVELEFVGLLVELSFVLVLAFTVEDDVVLGCVVLSATALQREGHKRTCAMSIFVAR